MGQPRDSSSSSPTEYVNLPFYSFAFWWLIIFCVHLLTCAYNAAFAKFYWDFDASFLSYSLEAYEIGMPRESFLTIAFMHVVIACAHGLCVLHMLIHLICGSASCKRRSRLSPVASKGFNKMIAGHQSAVTQQLDEDRLGRVTRNFTRVYLKLTHRRGLFGVNGKYFHTIQLFREILETVLQTIQAIRMSKYLPRPELNYFYVGLVVANCWSSVFLYSRWFSRGEAQRRFALMVCDCALDLMSTMGVTAMIVLQYVDQYNVQLTGFDFDLLADEDWFAQMLNEAQMILVVSWSDMTMRVIFSLGLIMTMTNMKELLRYSPKRRSRQVSPVSPQDQDGMNNLKSSPLSSYGINGLMTPPLTTYTNIHVDSRVRVSKRGLTSKETVVRTAGRLNAFHGAHALFLLWGIVVLVLHTLAVSREPLEDCIPKVHPIFPALPSCFVVNFDCHKLGIVGTLEEVRRELNKFDRKSAVKLHVLHCPQFAMPASFQDFTRMQEIRVYNSTINEWNGNAAITNSHHPKLTVVSVVRTNMNNGVLPLGFQSFDFPAGLFEIYFCETNLESIPDDIDSKWPIGVSVYVENSKLTAVPPALIRLQPFYLILGGNPITEVPPQLFEVTGMLYLILGRTNITMLPRTIINPTITPHFIDVRDTSISFFWSWIDPLLETMLDISPLILASGSLYCNDLERIMSGTSHSFSTSFQTGYSPLLMNASEQNWELLRQAVDCSPPVIPTMFPLAEWDEMYRLEQ